VAPLPLTRFQRTMGLVDSVLAMTARELEYAQARNADPEILRDLLEQGLALREEYKRVRDSLQQAMEAVRQAASNRGDAEPIDDPFPELVRTAEALLARAENYAERVDALFPPRETDPDRLLETTLEEVDRLIRQSRVVLEDQEASLVPVEIDGDEAMLTALTLRFDLTNTRESLADRWRDVKYAADELKSILNLGASQRISTRSGLNRPFDFTFDDSNTRLALQFDAPLNRRQQRNAFRAALINYNVGLRELLQQEDEIKRTVRQNLRELQLQQELYQNEVASAALAYERVVSTRIQQALGLENVNARDVVESQAAYTQSLIQVAEAHTEYIRQRIQLFLDLELLEVDENGFWPRLYDEDYQPTPHLEMPAYAVPVYGELPAGVCPSDKIKRMLHVPPGVPGIFRPQHAARTDGEPSEPPAEPGMLPAPPAAEEAGDER
jgi:hypothetical protein